MKLTADTRRHTQIHADILAPSDGAKNRHRFAIKQDGY